MTQGVTTSGWFFLVFGWGFILTLTIYCFSRVLFGKKPEVVVEAGGREQWGSRIGLILAVAGNAIGLGNFLRFPVKAAANGGGAFMIPYFVAFLLLGIPMMWVEWTIGRMGGAHGHGTTPGMFHVMWKKAPSKYLGALGIVIPFVIVIYYNFIESWCLGYSWFSVTGKYFGHANREAMGQFLRGFQGIESNEFFSSLVPVLIFWGITIGLNFYFLYKGISKGIEILAKYGMPLLFIFGIILVVRVLTLGTPDPSQPEMNIANGMGFIWNPDFSRLGSATRLAGRGRADLLHPEPGPGHHQHLRLLRPGEAGHHPERPDDLVDQRVRRGHPGRHDRHPGGRGLLRPGRDPGHRPGRAPSTSASRPCRSSSRRSRSARSSAACGSSSSSSPASPRRWP